jgi:hypothetical protein
MPVVTVRVDANAPLYKITVDPCGVIEKWVTADDPPEHNGN